MDDSEVDREKATVPDVVDQEKCTVEDTPDDDIVNRQGKTVAGKWTITCHVQEVTNKALLKGIPKESQLQEWNVPVIFGRGTNVNIFLNDERASRRHLELIGQLSTNGQACFTIRNLSSTNTLFVNGQNISSSNQRNIVRTGDKVTVASLSFELEIIPGEDTQNFILEFVHPHEKKQNTEVGVNNPSSIVFMPPMGPVSPGFQGGIPVTVPVPPGVQMGIPMGAYQGFIPSGSIPAQQFPFMHPPLPGDGLQIPYDALKFFVENQGKVNFVRLDDLRFLAYEAVKEWKELGRALRVPDCRLASIDLDHRKHSEKAYQMLLTWVCMNPYNATYEELMNALNDVTVGRSDLAKKYCSTKTEDQEIETNTGAV